jgi:diketogulonate reductase-like aldo/keto reductase
MKEARMRHLRLPDGDAVLVLGLGTWGMGEARTRGPEMVAALALGIDLGMTLIDTAEMYGEGGAEEIVGQAIAGRRNSVFIVSKVYPHNATRKGAIAACERSLKRLHTDRLDLYLLHWRGEVPLAETLEAFAALRQSGKIRRYGVSNFDLGDMEEWWALAGGDAAATNQILYNLARRGPEWALLPWLRRRHVPIMAYSPIEQGRLIRKRALHDVAKRPGVIAIPKAAQPDHVRENHGALGVTLSAEDVAELDAAFPPPRKAEPLAML